MDAATKITAVTPQTIAQTSSASAGGDFRRSKSSEDAERLARYRLVIEEGPQNGSFVYKIMDRVTGEVVRQLPRESVMNLLGDDAYSAGSVISTTA